MPAGQRGARRHGLPDRPRARPPKALGFERPTANSLDSVSDRDFALDYLSAAAQCSLHLSRLAEELIIWASAPFGFVKLSDEFSTGSSIMPQKRNPDAAELVRGHSGRIVGALTSLMVTMKGLPLAYSKDMQDDKEPVFEARDLLMLSLQALAGMVETVEFVPERMREAAAQGYLDRDRPRRLAGARGRRAVPRGAPHHRPRGEGWRRSAAAISPSFRSTTCRRSTRASTSACSTCSASMRRCAAARATAAPRRTRRPRADRGGESENARSF